MSKTLMANIIDKKRESGGIKAFKDALKTTAFLLKITMVLLVLAFVFSNMKYLEQFEKAIVLRFGAPQGPVREQAGMQFALPFPVDQVIVVKAGRTQSLTSRTFMYQASKTNEVSPFLKPGVDGYILTADGNIIHCESTLKYSVEDINEFVFSVKQGTMDENLTGLLDNSVLKAASKLTMEQVLDKKDLIADSKLILQKQIDELGLGVKVELLDLKIIIPRQVEVDRQEVTKAMQYEARIRSEADLYTKKSQDIAVSSASKVKSEAEVWKTKTMARAEADLKILNDLSDSYRNNPERIKEMLLSPVIADLLRSGETFLFDSKKNRELRVILPKLQKAKLHGINNNNTE